ncbi:glucose-6-phosphate dehydrogenase assembly protein OpcA [Corynebacterium aquatimens]|uniref:Glucose-6-phosphate dehydrogenase assembly protein OpcA n=1 Tax=Corynebacterium aquatimens TaxID=1190508 RepID=A0A931E0K8_9CORY|nr:glucose-6-phosphate dehydrogenase assembly protein OpcA [Corynebacterium aquatimens]MBG6121657.1 glucose-6-phosphate dehydrogenase assembly protein OpcA [Corynebacterium aquatimens]WJY65804.1 Glucose-6-phosphate dehydrogenase subunit [Corynebacterium aquatimens]
MIVTLSDTNTRDIARLLLDTQENHSLATGRVLTLIVVADIHDDVESILENVRAASHEHPSRVLMLITGNKEGPDALDAQALLAADAGASEIVIMDLHGDLARNLDSVVTPLLLPDTPIVAWWPSTAPAHPAEHPLGRIAHRRITNAYEAVDGNYLLRLANGYTPGDSDMLWSRITHWRGVVAAAFDAYPHDKVTAVEIDGPDDNPSVDIAAGWLSSCLGIDVNRITSEQTKSEPSRYFPIRRLTLERESGPVVVSVKDDKTLSVKVPGIAEAFVAMSTRSDADCLSEELRHLDPDFAYSQALKALPNVKVH